MPITTIRYYQGWISEESIDVPSKANVHVQIERMPFGEFSSIRRLWQACGTSNYVNWTVALRHEHKTSHSANSSSSWVWTKMQSNETIKVQDFIKKNWVQANKNWDYIYQCKTISIKLLQINKSTNKICCPKPLPKNTIFGRDDYILFCLFR